MILTTSILINIPVTFSIVMSKLMSFLEFNKVYLTDRRVLIVKKGWIFFFGHEINDFFILHLNHLH